MMFSAGITQVFSIKRDFHTREFLFLVKMGSINSFIVIFEFISSRLLSERMEQSGHFLSDLLFFMLTDENPVRDSGLALCFLPTWEAVSKCYVLRFF